VILSFMLSPKHMNSMLYLPLIDIIFLFKMTNIKTKIKEDKKNTLT